MASAPPCAHSLGHPLSPRACAMERVVFESLPMRRTLLMGGSWFWVLMITAAHQLKRSFQIGTPFVAKSLRDGTGGLRVFADEKNFAHGWLLVLGSYDNGCTPIKTILSHRSRQEQEKRPGAGGALRGVGSVCAAMSGRTRE